VGLRHLLSNNCAGLLLAPGLGKTSTSLAAIKILKDKGMINKVLVVAPLRPCYMVWPAELKKWSNFEGLKCTVLHGRKKNKILEDDSDIHCINPEGLPWLFGDGSPAAIKKFKSLGYDTLLIDELSKFKATNTQRFKLIKKYLNTFTRRWGLTGSPASSGLEGLFGQCYMLDQGAVLGKYITQYRNKFFNQNFNGYGWTIKEGAQEEIYKTVSPLFYRVGEEALDMPSQIDNKIFVDLPEKSRTFYKQLEDDLVAKLSEDEVVVAANSATASVKLRQVCAGAIYKENEEFVVGERGYNTLHDEKINALKDLISELQGNPVLIGYNFKHDLERLKKVFGKDIPYIGSGVSGNRTAELERLWNEGELPYLFGHPQSMGHGLNLQKAGNHVAWFSLPWSYDNYDQFNRRVRRQGNKNSTVYIHHILAKNTIDEVMLSALKGNKSLQDSFFEAIKSLQKGRKNEAIQIS